MSGRMPFNLWLLFTLEKPGLTTIISYDYYTEIIEDWIGS